MATSAEGLSGPIGPLGGLIDGLRAIGGHLAELSAEAGTRRFATGYRFGQRPVLGVVRPRTLVESWRMLKMSVEAAAIISMQSANTSLTGGLTRTAVMIGP